MLHIYRQDRTIPIDKNPYHLPYIKGGLGIIERETGLSETGGKTRVCEGQPTKRGTKQTSSGVSYIMNTESKRATPVTQSAFYKVLQLARSQEKNGALDITGTASADDVALHMQAAALRLCSSHT